MNKLVYLTPNELEIIQLNKKEKKSKDLNTRKTYIIAIIHRSC